MYLLELEILPLVQVQLPSAPARLLVVRLEVQINEIAHFLATVLLAKLLNSVRLRSELGTQNNSKKRQELGMQTTCLQFNQKSTVVGIQENRHSDTSTLV